MALTYVYYRCPIAVCPTLCDPMDCSPPGSSVHGTLQAGILEWVAMSSSRPSSQPRDRTHISCIAGGFFTTESSERPKYTMKSESESEVTQSCLTLCDPMGCSPPGSSVHGIFQARVLAWLAISFSRGSSRPWDQTQVSCTAGRFFTN